MINLLDSQCSERGFLLRCIFFFTKITFSIHNIAPVFSSRTLKCAGFSPGDGTLLETFVGIFNSLPRDFFFCFYGIVLGKHFIGFVKMSQTVHIVPRRRLPYGWYSVRTFFLFQIPNVFFFQLISGLIRLQEQKKNKTEIIPYYNIRNHTRFTDCRLECGFRWQWAVVDFRTKSDLNQLIDHSLCPLCEICPNVVLILLLCS